MDRYVLELERSIKRYLLHWRHPKDLNPILKMIERGRMRPHLTKLWFKKIEPWIDSQEKCFNPFPPAPDKEQLGHFDIELGELIENPGVRIGIRVLKPGKHLIVSGTTGAGKSTILRRIVDGLNAINRGNIQFITMLILDFKGDFVDVPKRLGKDIWYHFSAGNGLKLGCGPPSECINQVSWINQFTKVPAAHFPLKFSEASLESVIRIGFNLVNYPFTGTIIWPSLLLISQLISALPTYLIAKKEEYKQTLQQKIDYLLRTSGDLFGAERGFDIYEHLVKPKKCAIIDCTTLSPLVGQILVNLLALQLLFSRVTLRQVSDRTNFALIIDEADQFLSDEVGRIYPEGYSAVGQFVKQARQFGGFGAFGVSFLGGCSQLITSNVVYPLIMNQSDPISIVQATRLLLEPESGHLIASLKIGEGIYKEAMGPVPYGMLMKADDVPASNMPRPEKFDQHSFTPARGIKDIPGLAEKLEKLKEDFNKTTLRQAKQKKSTQTLSDNERVFLSHMSLHEFEPIHRLFMRMENPSPATQLNIIRKLVKLELIETKNTRTSKSNIRLGLITQRGWDYLKDRSKFPSPRGGIEHAHFAHWIQDVETQRGCQECHLEWPIINSNGFGDLGIKRNDKWHCVEVVVGCVSNICDHVKSCFIESDAIETLTIVTAVKSMHDEIYNKIKSDPTLLPFISKIEFEVIDTYMKELWSS
jgi:hypothetical protein